MNTLSWGPLALCYIGIPVYPLLQGTVLKDKAWGETCGLKGSWNEVKQEVEHWGREIDRKKRACHAPLLPTSLPTNFLSVSS